MHNIKGMKKDNDGKWAIIRKCLDDAMNQNVEQVEMTAFLKKTFHTAIQALRDLVIDGINLADKDVVAQLQELIIAMSQPS